MPKYEPDTTHWQQDDEGETEDWPTRVKSHKVDVILTTDPTESHGYGREKYTAHVVHDDEDDDHYPCVTHFVKHRWKGNYWRDTHQVDWRDVPGLVKRQVAAVVDCDGVDDLDPGHRLIEEGGRSTWRRHKDEGASEVCPDCGSEGEADDVLPDALRRCPRKTCSVVTFREVADNRTGGDSA